MKTRYVAIAGALAALSLLAAACGNDAATGAEAQASDETAEPGSSSAPVVIATTSIWGDVVANVACDGLVDVQVMIPVGGDPHSFEPSLADRADMEAAALVVANGLRLEERLEDTIDSVEAAGTPVFRVGDHVDTIEFGNDDHDHADEDHAEHDDHAGHDHSHDGNDPHVWFDPVRTSAALPELAAALVAEAGLDADAVDACLASYQAELESTDAAVEAALDAVPAAQRQLVTNHDALGYFADRYGFTVVGTVIPSSSTLAETNPAELDELAEVVEEAGVGAIFGETQHSSDDAAALADRLGPDVELITLYTGTLGEAGSGADTYTGFLMTNAQLIADGLT